MKEYPKYEIVNIDRLKPLEYVFKHHLSNLESMIEDFVNKPLIADINSGTILDGSHRFVFFYKNGYEEIPVLWVDYQDERISTGIELTKNEILNRSKLLPPRTTRHKFFFTKDDIPTNLRLLKKNKEREYNHLVCDSTIEEEIEHNKKYLLEMEETRLYIQKQLNLMKPEGYFVGKFNPPHMGHAVTILKLMNEYNLTVVVTNDVPKNSKYSQDDIISEIKNLNVNVIKFDKKLTDQDSDPFGKLLLSGNEDVIEWCKNKNIKCKFVPRSGRLESKKMR
jgi:hypothetical protein